MTIAILSDIHGNLAALEAVFKSLRIFALEGIVLLGDLVDYGPHSNEVICSFQNIKIPILCNIIGNHEYAILNDDYSRFSSERGILSAKHTKETLDENSWNFIKKEMNNEGMEQIEMKGCKCLVVHGSLRDRYWKSIMPGDDLLEYSKYDYVFSGHSHYPHYFSMFSKVDNPVTRNRRKTVFINPGSVGQPRNICSNAQYSVLDFDTGEVIMRCVPYNIKEEQEAFSNEVDSFYKTRLEVGV